LKSFQAPWTSQKFPIQEGGLWTAPCCLKLACVLKHLFTIR
jgi:hypothetical protein